MLPEGPCAEAAAARARAQFRGLCGRPPRPRRLQGSPGAPGRPARGRWWQPHGLSPATAFGSAEHGQPPPHSRDRGPRALNQAPSGAADGSTSWGLPHPVAVRSAGPPRRLGAHGLPCSEDAARCSAHSTVLSCAQEATSRNTDGAFRPPARNGRSPRRSPRPTGTAPSPRVAGKPLLTFGSAARCAWGHARPRGSSQLPEDGSSDPCVLHAGSPRPPSLWGFPRPRPRGGSSRRPGLLPGQPSPGLLSPRPSPDPKAVLSGLPRAPDEVTTDRGRAPTGPKDLRGLQGPFSCHCRLLEES